MRAQPKPSRKQPARHKPPARRKTLDQPKPSVRSIKASEFKAKCLRLMDEVADTGEALVVTKNGRPVVRVSAAAPKRYTSTYGVDKDRIKILGDIVAPLYPDYDEWGHDADQPELWETE